VDPRRRRFTDEQSQRHRGSSHPINATKSFTGTRRSSPTGFRGPSTGDHVNHPRRPISLIPIASSQQAQTPIVPGGVRRGYEENTRAQEQGKGRCWREGFIPRVVEIVVKEPRWLPRSPARARPHPLRQIRLRLPTTRGLGRGYR
jgi:hypothetical protein